MPNFTFLFRMKLQNIATDFLYRHLITKKNGPFTLNDDVASLLLPESIKDELYNDISVAQVIIEQTFNVRYDQLTSYMATFAVLANHANSNTTIITDFGSWSVRWSNEFVDSHLFVSNQQQGVRFVLPSIDDVGTGNIAKCHVVMYRHMEMSHVYRLLQCLHITTDILKDFNSLDARVYFKSKTDSQHSCHCLYFESEINYFLLPPIQDFRLFVKFIMNLGSTFQVIDIEDECFIFFIASDLSD